MGNSLAQETNRADRGIIAADRPKGKERGFVGLATDVLNTLQPSCQCWVRIPETGNVAWETVHGVFQTGRYTETTTLAWALAA